MLTKNELFGILTGLVEEHRKTDNFFQALNFKDNFFKINTLMSELIKVFDDIDIKECFDYNSECKAKKEFKYISFIDQKGMVEYISDNFSDIIETINIKENIVEIFLK